MSTLTRNLTIVKKDVHDILIECIAISFNVAGKSVESLIFNFHPNSKLLNSLKHQTSEFRNNLRTFNELSSNETSISRSINLSKSFRQLNYNGYGVLIC